MKKNRPAKEEVIQLIKDYVDSIMDHDLKKMKTFIKFRRIHATKISMPIYKR